MKRMRPPALAVTLCVLAIWPAACRRANATRERSANAEAVGTTGQGIKFAVTVEFTGDHQLRGTFVDDDHGGDGSCATYVRTNVPVVGWMGPQTPAGRAVKVAGEIVRYGIMVRQDRYHGPGTYTGSVMSGVSIGDETFIGPTSSVTINPDGSGSATFTDFTNLRVFGRESGTVRWTCSPG